MPIEHQFVEHVNHEIIANPQLWPILERDFGMGFIGTTHFHPHNFYLTHFLEHEWTGQGNIVI
jgi:hypothetical protein